MNTFYNMCNILLAQMTMENAEKHGMLSRTQYGCRKNHTAMAASNILVNVQGSADWSLSCWLARLLRGSNIVVRTVAGLVFGYWFAAWTFEILGTARMVRARESSFPSGGLVCASSRSSTVPCRPSSAPQLGGDEGRGSASTAGAPCSSLDHRGTVSHWSPSGRTHDPSSRRHRVSGGTTSPITSFAPADGCKTAAWSWSRLRTPGPTTSSFPGAAT